MFNFYWLSRSVELSARIWFEECGKPMIWIASSGNRCVELEKKFLIKRRCMQEWNIWWLSNSISRRETKKGRSVGLLGKEWKRDLRGNKIADFHLAAKYCENFVFLISKLTSNSSSEGTSYGWRSIWKFCPFLFHLRNSATKLRDDDF